MVNYKKAVLFMSNIIMLIAAFGCSFLRVPDVSKYDVDSTREKNKHHPIVRIVGKKDYRSCTAFVVSDLVAVTAAHCIAKNPKEMKQIYKENVMGVFNSKGEFTEVVASPVYMSNHRDVGLIYGDFSGFSKLKLEDKSTIIGGDILKVCGYPYGDEMAVCNNFKAVSHSGTAYVGVSAIFKGMSGGPIIDENGRVVGVLFAKLDSIAMFEKSTGISQYVDRIREIHDSKMGQIEE